MLEAQKAYGSEAAQIREIPGASFGFRLFPNLPEDIFDSQPLIVEDSLLVADVRLDNRLELAAALGIERADLEKLADSDLVLCAWRQWGEACFNRLIGDFAIAVFRMSERRLYLARDPTGQRPLFYAELPEGIAFSSMPSGVLALEGSSCSFDLAQIARALTDVPNTGPDTYFRGLKRVLPGYVVTIEPGRIASRRYWNPQVCRAQSDERNYVEEYRDLLDQAVGARLRRARGSISTQLSAGLDSSAVTSTAALLELQMPMYALTAAPRENFNEPVPRGKLADESLLAAITARMHGLDHVVVRPSGSLLDHIRREVKSHQEPHRNIINGSWIAALNLKAQELGSSMLLTGELGNLTLNAGSASVLGDFIQTGQWLRWYKEARAATTYGHMRAQGVLLNSFGWLLPSGAMRLIRGAYLHERAPNDLTFLRAEWASAGHRTATDSVSQSGNSYRDRLSVLGTLDFGTDRKGALASAGIDTRDPLSDRRLIEFSLKLPPRELFRNGIQRNLAREALSDRLPRPVLQNMDRGYQSADWFELMRPTEVRELVEEISTSSVNQQMIDFAKLNRAIDRWPNSDFYRSDIVSTYVGFLPLTLAVGMFILQMERSLNALRSTVHGHRR